MPIESACTKRPMFDRLKLTFDETVNEIKFQQRVFKQGRMQGITRGPWVRVRKQDMVKALEDSDSAYFQCDIIPRGMMIRGVM